MKLYNTLTRKKEEFIPLDKNEIKIYSCGPTVYNYFHIGNARPFIIFDTLCKYLNYRGFNVKFVQNFTDIDDKMIKRANEEGVTVKELADKYIAEYFIDASGLGIKKADIQPKATENIDGIIEMVKTLVEKGFAYETSGDVYFRAKSFKGYGKLSHQPLEDLESGARVEVSEIKEDPMDFALWKAAKPNEPFWESPWGKGRPGWHIECSVMANKYLGKTIDIHCGGQDLIFPHHENEIAQSEAANGCDFAHYWLHNGYINVDNRKMSKSLNNFFMVRDAAKEYGYETIRFFMLSVHYRSPISYSSDILEQSKAGLERLYNCLENIDFLFDSAKTETADVNNFNIYRERFCEAMDDDLNTAEAVSVLFDLVKDINTAVNSEKEITKEYLTQAKSVLQELSSVLGLLENCKGNDLDSEIEALIEKREEARKSRNFKEADAIRSELKSKGIILEDTPQGVKWKKINS